MECTHVKDFRFSINLRIRTSAVRLLGLIGMPAPSLHIVYQLYDSHAQVQIVMCTLMDVVMYMSYNIVILRYTYFNCKREYFMTVFDKWDSFHFAIVNFPHMTGNIPSKPAYGVYISQLVRIGRICNSFVEFKDRHYI